MSTVVRAKISKKNPYYISKHRYYELKHFCLQYYEFKQKYDELCIDIYSGTIKVTVDDSKNYYGNQNLWLRQYYLDCMQIIEDCCHEIDIFDQYIFRAVTEGLSYTYLRTRLNIPAGKDMYYEQLRKFFWLLDSRKSQILL